jgi:hypothetical protein
MRNGGVWLVAGEPEGCLSCAGHTYVAGPLQAMRETQAEQSAGGARTATMNRKRPRIQIR